MAEAQAKAAATRHRATMGFGADVVGISGITANVLKISRALLDAPDEGRYGYELMRSTRLTSTSMYKALHRMQASGWLTSYLEDADPRELLRPRRRYYQLTEQGDTMITRYLQHWTSVLRGHAA